MGTLKYKLMQFMSGRYGADKLNHCLLCLYLALWILNVFIFSQIISLVLDIAELSIIVIVILRMFSRNIYKRRKENETFVRLFGKYLPDINLLRNRIKDRHTHIYKKCPECKAVLRLRKIKGEHTAKCPRCGSKVNVKIR